MEIQQNTSDVPLFLGGKGGGGGGEGLNNLPAWDIRSQNNGANKEPFFKPHPQIFLQHIEEKQLARPVLMFVEKYFIKVIDAKKVF